MKLLLDQNLSRKLIGRLSDLYPDSTHVAFQGLVESTDREVWDFAAALPSSWPASTTPPPAPPLYQSAAAERDKAIAEALSKLHVAEVGQLHDAAHS